MWARSARGAHRDTSQPQRIGSHIPGTVAEELVRLQDIFKKPIQPPFWIRAEQNGLEQAGARLAEEYGEKGLRVCMAQRSRRRDADPHADVHLYV